MTRPPVIQAVYLISSRLRRAHLKIPNEQRIILVASPPRLNTSVADATPGDARDISNPFKDLDIK
jgi:hypothetical protein